MSLNRRSLLAAGLGLAVASAFRPVIALAQAGGQDAPTAELLLARASDGLNLTIRSYGTEGNPEILFLHGLGQSHLAWERQVAALADRYRVVTWDLRGHGDSDKPLDVAAYADAALWADDVAAVIEAAELRNPTLVGWSFGGYVIGQYLARHGSSRVRGVNLVDAVTTFDYTLFGPAGLQYSPGLTSPDLATRTDAIVNFLAACFAVPPPDDVFDRMIAYNAMVPVAVHAGIGQLSPEGVDAAFAAVPRMLVSYGAKDSITTAEMSRRVLDLNPAARMVTYGEAGHAPFFDATDRFNADLAAFCEA